MLNAALLPRTFNEKSFPVMVSLSSQGMINFAGSAPLVSAQEAPLSAIPRLVCFGRHQDDGF